MSNNSTWEDELESLMQKQQDAMKSIILRAIDTNKLATTNYTQASFHHGNSTGQTELDLKQQCAQQQLQIATLTNQTQRLENTIKFTKKKNEKLNKKIQQLQQTITKLENNKIVANTPNISNSDNAVTIVNKPKNVHYNLF